MEADRREPPTQPQQSPGSGKAGVERLELAVDRDPQSLEGPLGRMPAAEAIGGGDGDPNRIDKLGGGLERAAPEQLGGDRASVTLLPVVAQDRGDPLLRPRI